MNMVNYIDPANQASFSTIGVTQKWQVKGGDQSYGDFIRFSEDCNIPKSTDFSMMRQTNGQYNQINIVDFPVGGNYYMCIKPAFINGIIPYFDTIRDITWKIVSLAMVATSSPPDITMN